MSIFIHVKPHCINNLCRLLDNDTSEPIFLREMYEQELFQSHERLRALKAFPIIGFFFQHQIVDEVSKRLQGYRRALSILIRASLCEDFVFLVFDLEHVIFHFKFIN